MSETKETNAQQEKSIVLNDIKQSPCSFLSELNMSANATIDKINPIIYNVISFPPFPLVSLLGLKILQNPLCAKNTLTPNPY